MPIKNSALKLTSPSDESSQWAILALTRFFLAMVVVVGHLCSLVTGSDSWTYVGLYFNQGSAVLGFFIISGYSISSSLDKNPEQFYRRRFIRIYPVYILVIIISVIMSVTILKAGLIWPQGAATGPTELFEVVCAFFMLQMILVPAIPIIGQIWSIAPEWWYYIFAPYIRKLNTVTVVSLIAFSLAFNISFPPPGGDNQNYKYGLVIIALAWLWLSGFLYHRHRKSYIAILLIVIPSLVANFYGVFTGKSLFITILIILIVQINTYKLKQRTKILFNNLGDISYPLYLIHPAIFELFIYLKIHSPSLILVTSLTLSLLIVIKYERPISTYLRRALVFK